MFALALAIAAAPAAAASTAAKGAQDRQAPGAVTIPVSSRSEGRLFGVHQDLTYYGNRASRSRLITAARSLGATVSRSSFLWHRIEPTRGRRVWNSTDDSINELVRVGIEPLMVVVGSPAWANGSADPFAVPTGWRAFRRWVTDYRAFVVDAIRRYRGRVQYWEIWNEPNEGYFWKPGLANAARYAYLYRVLRRAILEGDPTAEVAVGGLAGLVESCCVSGEAFLHQLLAAGVPIDNVAVHAYSDHAPDLHVAGEANFDDIDAIRVLLDESDHSHVGMWLTEWGWPTPPLSLDTQATFVQRSLELLRERYAYVELATYFIDVDRRPEFNHGLFNTSFEAKPSGRAFAAFMASLRNT